MQTMTHYQHLANKFPFTDEILVNRTCARIIRFRSDWMRARSHYAHVTNRLRRILFRIVKINVRTETFLRIENDTRINVCHTQWKNEREKNHARMRKWIKIATQFIGRDAAIEMRNDMIDQFYPVR